MCTPWSCRMSSRRSGNRQCGKGARQKLLSVKGSERGAPNSTKEKWQPPPPLCEKIPLSSN